MHVLQVNLVIKNVKNFLTQWKTIDLSIAILILVVQRIIWWNMYCVYRMCLCTRLCVYANVYICAIIQRANRANGNCVANSRCNAETIHLVTRRHYIQSSLDTWFSEIVCNTAFKSESYQTRAYITRSIQIVKLDYLILIYSW